MQTLDSYIDFKRQQIFSEEQKLNTLEILRKRFALELVPMMGQGNSALISADVNSMVEHVEFECCHELNGVQPTFARPFVMFDGVKIYSKPYSFALVDIDFELGEKDSGPEINWIQKMQEAGIPEAVILKVKLRILK